MQSMSGRTSYVTLLLLCVTIVVALPSCKSRYRLNLYMLSGGEQKKIKVEATEFARGAIIQDPLAEQKLRAGTGNTVILNLGGRGRSVQMGEEHLLKFDEYFRCQLYIQLPLELRPDTLDLPENSFAQIQGRYDLKVEEKTFLADSGTVILDSLHKDDLYATIDGRFLNQFEDTLGFAGQFKVKVTD
jgi:hypothetical protein